MRPKPYHGWYIVLCALLVELFGWGLGFYGPGVYLYFLQQKNGWYTSVIESAVTAYSLSGALLLAGVGELFERFGPRVVVPVAPFAMHGVVSLIPLVREP